MSKYPLIDLLKDYPKMELRAEAIKKMSFDQRVQQAFAWARERHSIFLLRNFYEVPPPWSSLPHMAQTRWCNVYRELDRVTQWFVYNVYLPNVDNPNLWFAAMICRYINFPESIQDLMDANCLGLSGRWDWRKAAAVLNERKHNKKQFVTGAYLVNSVSSSHFPPEIMGSKPDVISYRLNHAWENRSSLNGSFKGTMKDAFDAVSSVPGFGNFLSYQVCVDLSYSKKWLKNAPDLNSFNAAGPGTKRGAQRIKYGRDKSTFEAIGQEETTEVLSMFLEKSRSIEYWPRSNTLNPGDGWAPLSMSNVSNLFCEHDKNTRVLLREGTTRSRYVADQSLALF